MKLQKNGNFTKIIPSRTPFSLQGLGWQACRLIGTFFNFFCRTPIIMKIRSRRAAQRFCWVTQFAWWGFLQHYRTLIPLLLPRGVGGPAQCPATSSFKIDCIMRMALSSSYSFLYSFLNGMHFLFSFYSILLETFLIAWHRISLISDCSQWTPCILCCHNEVKAFMNMHYS